MRDVREWQERAAGPAAEDARAAEEGGARRPQVPPAPEPPHEPDATGPAAAARRALREARLKEEQEKEEGEKRAKEEREQGERQREERDPDVAGAPGERGVRHGAGAEPPGEEPVGSRGAGDRREPYARSCGDAPAEAAPQERPDREPAASRTPSRPPGPADAARAALRRAAAERPDRSGGPADDAEPAPARPAEEAGEPAGAADREPAPGTTARAAPRPAGAPRPADAAREALRMARIRRARTGTVPAAAPPGGDRPPAGTRQRPGARGRVAGIRARNVKELLADASRKPAPTSAPEGSAADPPTGNYREEHGSSAPRGEAPAARATDPPAAATSSSPTPSAASAFRVPPTMASPRRDGELRRTFPAFPPGAPDDGGRFAATWWGNAWVTALEEGALDAARLARGRVYAEQGNVDAITVTPGLVLAYVRGSRPRPYRTQVRLRTFDDAEWGRFLDAAAERPGHIAALLDRELPHALAETGVPLLPAPGDLDPRCSCPDRGHPCKHAAALCYQTARLLDADPFVLLLLRGRGERELLDALSRRSATRAARAAGEREPAPLPGVRASDAVARGERPPLPPPLPVPPHPGQPPVYPAAPGGPDPLALDQLATDAAARAHALLATGHDPAGGLTLWQDAVRLAAARPGSGLTAASRALYAALASAAGRTPADLARAVAAWRQGGREGLAVLEEPWDPPAGRFDRARPQLLAADLPAFRPWRNRLTHPRGHVQLRLGRDGLWYAYESEPGRDDWWPRGTADPDPVGALTGVGVALTAPDGLGAG
ncbi:SWIM zinc finger family protein [Streptomyces echinoruber]|uniref:SWIM-type domain-containing protein n=1 Tax=Streptomyces echinoruber TaxID=68898 RepID=A0A918RG51_9ACTN|nr:SWIM zinc finger family protein [Streptomyces echinoruber]GGZ97638.1 hypothetical protein GCM10010389_41070 [Streptomyces echinoruber]